MAKFDFRHTGLLALREAHRDEKRAHLLQALAAADRLRLEAQRLERELADLRHFTVRAGRGGNGGGIDVDRLLEAHRYELVLRAQQQTLAGQQQLVEAEIEQRRQALVQADQEVRILEKLREAQLARHRRTEEQREMKRLDEVAGRRAAARGQPQ